MTKILKNKNSILFAILLLICGVVLMFSDKVLLGEKPDSTENNENTKQEISGNDTEKRLEDILSNVKGVGMVKVMIEYSEGPETVIAENHTKESNSLSGNNQTKEQYEAALSNNNPIILKEIKPKVKGVVIVAQGGENVEIKDKLINAVMSLLDIDANKIEVLTMK